MRFEAIPVIGGTTLAFSDKTTGENDSIFVPDDVIEGMTVREAMHWLGGLMCGCSPTVTYCPDCMKMEEM